MECGGSTPLSFSALPFPSSQPLPFFLAFVGRDRNYRAKLPSARHSPLLYLFFYLVWMPARRSHDCNTAFMPWVHDVLPAFTS